MRGKLCANDFSIHLKSNARNQLDSKRMCVFVTFLHISFDFAIEQIESSGRLMNKHCKWRLIVFKFCTPFSFGWLCTSTNELSLLVKPLLN